MVKTTNILGYRINFVFRHRFEKTRGMLKTLDWRDYKLGVWFKLYKVLSKPKEGPAILGKDGTFSKGYLFGVNLLVCKFWIDICHRPLILSCEE